ncbi:Nitroreductase family protein [compost metagenome]
MNLMLALHAAGLGSCPLNTCMPWFKESRLKQNAGIPKHERLIMMIAVGNLLDEFSVAQSEKKPIEKILRQH